LEDNVPPRLPDPGAENIVDQSKQLGAENIDQSKQLGAESIDQSKQLGAENIDQSKQLEDLNQVILPNDSFPKVPQNLLTLPIEEQVKLVVGCYDKDKGNKVMGKMFAVGYSLGTSIRVASIGGRKRIVEEGQDIVEEGDAPVEEPKKKEKKVDKLLALYGEGGVRVDALTRTICHALVTHGHRFEDDISR
jgi:hypothetical protein